MFLSICFLMCFSSIFFFLHVKSLHKKKELSLWPHLLYYFICWNGFSYIVRKIRQIIFLLFDFNFWPPERIFESNLFHFKRFHFKSTSNGCFDKVWWKSGNHTKITIFSEAWLYVLVMSRTHFRVNPHSIVALMSKKSLLDAGAKSEV